MCSTTSTYVGNYVAEPSIFSKKLSEPISDGRVGIFRSTIDDGILKVNARLWEILSQASKFRPGVSLIISRGSAFLAYTERVRQTTRGSGEW
jgi:hypothetical protein